MPNDTDTGEGREFWEETMDLAGAGETVAVEKEETTQTEVVKPEAIATETEVVKGEAATENEAGETTSPEKGKEAGEDGKTTPEIKPEDVLAHLSPIETPEQKAARMDGLYKSSTTEALRLKGDNEAFADIFAGQNVEVVRDAKGRPTGIAPGKGYGKGDPEVSVKFDSLSNEVQEMAESDPQGFVDAVLNEAKSSLVRVAPTVEKAVKPLSPERVVEVETHLKGLVEADGSAQLPEFEANLPIIRQYVNDPAKSQSFKDFVAQNPEMAYEFAHLKVAAAKTFLQTAAQKAQEALLKKEQESADTLHPGPAGGGSPALTSSADIAKIGSDIGDQIAGATGY